MPITKDGGRQWPLVGEASFAIGDLTDGAAVEAVDVPYGAVILGGNLVVTTAFDSVTTDTLTVTIGSTTLLAATNAQALGSTPFTAGAAATTAGDTVDVQWDQTGGAGTAGAATVYVTYVIDGRATEVQPV